MLKSRNNPDAKKAADFVKKAEQLYIDALEEIGAKYVNNKVIGANDEEKEKETSSEIKKLKKAKPNRSILTMTTKQAIIVMTCTPQPPIL